MRGFEMRMRLIRDIRELSRWLGTIDTAYQRQLVKVYGRKHAGDARYMQSHIEPRCEALQRLYRKVGRRYDEAWQAYRAAQIHTTISKIAGL